MAIATKGASTMAVPSARSQISRLVCVSMDRVTRKDMNRSRGPGSAAPRANTGGSVPQPEGERRRRSRALKLTNRLPNQLEVRPSLLESGDPSRIRTCNPRSRNPLLYPVELWDRWRLYIIANMKNPHRRQARSEPFSASPRQSLESGPKALVHLRRHATAAGNRRGKTAGFDKCCMRPFRPSVPPP
jgi:hypothetical protein